MRDIPSLLSLASPSMNSLDPEGANLTEDYASQLEPSDSRYDGDQNVCTQTIPRWSADFVMDDFRGGGQGQVVSDLKKIIRLPPPPPPTSEPPKRRRKQGIQSSNQAKIPLPSTATSGSKQTSIPEKTIEAGGRDNCDFSSITNSIKIMARYSSSSPKAKDIIRESPQAENGTFENDDNELNDFQGDQNPRHSRLMINPITSANMANIPKDALVSPNARIQEHLDTEAHSHTTVTKPKLDQPHDTTLKETGETLSSHKMKAKNPKRTKKRRFFKKLFRGGKNLEETLSDQYKNHTSLKRSDPAPENSLMVSSFTDQEDDCLPSPRMVNGSDHHFQVPPVAHVLPELSRSLFEAADQVSNNLSSNIKDIDDNKSIEIEQATNTIFHGVHNKFQEFSLYHPINQNGDASESSRRLFPSPNEVLSREPAGASPVALGHTGRNHTNRFMSGDPQGETPKARENVRMSSNDPAGGSFCHASKTTKTFLDAETAIFYSDNSDLSLVDNGIPEGNEVGSSFDGKEGSNNSQYPDSCLKTDFESPEFVSPGKDRPAPISKVVNPARISLSIDTGSTISEQSSQIVRNDAEEKILPKKIHIGIEMSGFKSAPSTPTARKEPLTVSAAAFSNAKAMAYLHRLQGEPSPRLTWHSKNSIAPPLSEESLALAKIRAFNSKRKKGKVEKVIKIKGPSPDEYSATNAKVEAMIKEKNYVNHDPSSQFAPYSRFKGRRPRKMSATKPESLSHEITAMPLQGVIQPTVDLELVVPSGKLSGLALTRGTDLRQIRREAGIQSRSSAHVAATMSEKTNGGNRFNFFPANECEIKDPIQRAGRRLLSKSAIPIQAGIRMFLSRREAIDRMWALIRIQSYFRRWRCEASLYVHNHSITLVQKIYRGYRGREELKNRHIRATSIQKIVRGYLTALHAYETIYYVSRAQALARGFLVRTSNTRKAEALKEKQNAAVLIQNCYREHILRQLAAMMRRRCATAIQSVWRSFSSRIAFKMRIVNIITVQSIARQKEAIRMVDLIRKSIHSTAITRFQAGWRGYAERNRRQKFIAAKKIQCLWSCHRANGEYKKIRAATKIQASWRACQAYTDFIFVIVDILVVQRSARQWLAVRKTNNLRRDRAAIVIQSAWRSKRAQMNLVYSLVHIMIVQSIARRFLARNEVQIRRKEREQHDSVQRRKNLAATTIQKSWRGFWGFSHFFIVQYEITRIQALMRGKLSRDKFNLKIGCTILIQAASRRFLARKVASVKVIEKTVEKARALELRERNSAKHIQFWWRIVLDWMKEKRAALVIERFFMFVKAEVHRELREMEQKIIMSEKSQKKHQKKGSRVDKKRMMDKVGEFAPQFVKKDSRSQNATRPQPSQNNLPANNVNNYKSFQSRDDRRGFIEMSDMEAPPAILHLAPSEDFSMISNITNPFVLNQFPKGVESSLTRQTNSEEIYQEVRARSKNEKHRRLSTEDYIKKYGGLNTAPNNSLSKSQTHHFFSDDRKSGGDDRKQNRRSHDGTSAMYMQRQNKVTTPRKGRGHYGQPISLSTEAHNTTDFKVIGKTPANPRSSSGGNRSSGSTPRNATRNRRDTNFSQLLPPVTPTRKKSASILRSATAVTECSTPVENEKRFIPPRPRPSSPRKHSSIHGRGGNAVMIMKTNPDFMDDKTFEEAHEIMLLGDDYGEV